MRQRRVDTVLKVGRIVIIATVLVLVIAAVILYRSEGKGLTYFLFFVFPLFSLGTGMIAVLIQKKWIIVAVIYHLLNFLYLHLNDPERTRGYIIFFSCYILLSIISGLCFQESGRNNKAPK